MRPITGQGYPWASVAEKQLDSPPIKQGARLSRAHFLAVAAKYRAIAREKPSDGSENCEMLLTHLNSKSAFAATLEGVSFGMKDGKRTVRCLVTYKA